MLSSLDHPETGSYSQYRFYLKPSLDLFGLCSVTILNFPLSLMEPLLRGNLGFLSDFAGPLISLLRICPLFRHHCPVFFLVILNAAKNLLDAIRC